MPARILKRISALNSRLILAYEVVLVLCLSGWDMTTVLISCREGDFCKPFWMNHDNHSDRD